MNDLNFTQALSLLELDLGPITDIICQGIGLRRNENFINVTQNSHDS